MERVCDWLKDGVDGAVTKLCDASLEKTRGITAIMYFHEKKWRMGISHLTLMVTAVVADCCVREHLAAIRYFHKMFGEMPTSYCMVTAVG